MEIPMYMASSEDVSTEIDLIAWRKRHAIELPKWVNAFTKVFISSAIVSCSREGFFNFTKIYCATAVIFGRLHITFCNAAI